MNCLQARNGATAGDELLPDEGLPVDLAQQVRNRQAAVVYLQAAAMTPDAVARDLLRSQGAQLLLPRPGAGRPRRAC